MPTPAQASFSSAQDLDILKGDIKIDAALTKSDHLMGRYSIANNEETDPNQFPALKTQSLESRAQNVAFSETHIFGPHWLNEARASYYRDYFLFSQILPGTNFHDEAGITGYDKTQVTPSFPYITLSGYSAFNGSGKGDFPKSNRIRTWEYADTVSYTSGKHDVRFGGQMWVQRHSFYNGQSQEGRVHFHHSIYRRCVWRFSAWPSRSGLSILSTYAVWKSSYRMGRVCAGQLSCSGQPDPESRIAMGIQPLLPGH